MKSLLIIILAFCMDIAHSQSITIACPSKKKIIKQLGIGYLNMGATELGELCNIKENNNQNAILNFGTLAGQDVDATNINTGAIAASKTYQVAVVFELSATANVSDKLKADLTKELDRKLKFKLIKSRSLTLKDPSSQLKKYTLTDYDIRDNEVYALVNKIIVADTLEISTDSGLSLESNVSAKFGDATFELANKCESLIQIQGLSVPVFFDYARFKAQVKQPKQKGAMEIPPTVKWKRMKSTSVIPELEIEE